MPRSARSLGPSNTPARRGPRRLALAGLLAAALVGCGSDDDSASATRAVETSAARTGYPLTLRGNCGRDVTVERAPQRAVSVNQGSTEILLSLGLADRMVGTATWTDAIRPNLEAANARVPRLSDGEVSYERVLARDPDLVTASFAYALESGDPSRRAGYAQLGVPTYLAPSHCEGRTDATGDGPRDHPLQIDTIFREVRDLAAIFDVRERGEQLVGELDARLRRVRDTAPQGDDVSVAFWFANTESPYMAGCCGSSGIIARAVGVRNVFADTQTEWPQVSWESVLDRDPTVLVLGDLRRKSQSGDKLEDKIRFLETNRVTKRLTAVREKRYVIMNGADMNPSIRTVDGAEKLAAGLRKLGLAQ